MGGISESFPTMQTRDVVTSSATILGLIITAFGILVTLADEPEQVIIKNFALVFITVVALLVCAVIFTTLSSLLKKPRLWSGALIFYIFGWGFLGTLMMLTLIGYGYGIETLQLQLPQFNVEFVNVVSALVGLVVSILSVVISLRGILAYRRRISELSSKVKVSTAELKAEFNKLELASLDFNTQLVVLRTNIEREIRKLANLSKITKKKVGPRIPLTRLVYQLMEKKIFSPQLAKTTLFVYRECSRVVHGEIFSDKDARLVSELGLKTLVELRRTVQKFSEK